MIPIEEHQLFSFVFNSYCTKSWNHTDLWSHGSWIYNYLCNQCLSLLKLWVLAPLMARCNRYNIMWKVCQLLAICHWFSPGTPISSTNKTYIHDICSDNWNIVESGVKHHSPNPKPTITLTHHRHTIRVNILYGI